MGVKYFCSRLLVIVLWKPGDEIGLCLYNLIIIIISK